MDQAINALQRASLPDDIFNVAVVTFTDGLDQGSLMMNSNFSTDEQYLDAVNNRIVNFKINKTQICCII